MSELMAMVDTISEPWLITGDSNVFISSDERIKVVVPRSYRT